MGKKISLREQLASASGQEELESEELRRAVEHFSLTTGSDTCTASSKPCAFLEGMFDDDTEALSLKTDLEDPNALNQRFGVITK